MHRLKIQRVRRVPPIPTTIIVIPNVQLSILNYLLMISRDHDPEKNDITLYRPEIEQTVNVREGASRKVTPPESRKAK